MSLINIYEASLGVAAPIWSLFHQRLPCKHLTLSLRLACIHIYIYIHIYVCIYFPVW